MFGVNSLGTGINDFLGMFNVKGAGIGVAVDTLTGNSLGVLSNLHDQYVETAIGRGTGPIERRMSQIGLPPAGFMPSPMSMFPAYAPYCGCGYAVPPAAAAAGGLGGPFQHLLASNPFARAGFESSIGGQILSFGGFGNPLLTVQRFAPGFNPMGSLGYLNPMAAGAMGWFSNIAGAAMGLPAMLAGANPFMGMFGAGAVNAFGMFDNSGPLGGRGFGSWNPLAMPGRINNTNPAYESAHQAQVAGVLADPSLTVEDKVTLMIMLIMKKMDRDIERQAQYINSIQQQQSSRGGKGKGGKGFMGIGGGKGKGGGGGNNSPSIDVETMKLKRMIDKRGQMFDMLRQIIDKYNQTAKGIIDSIGR